jgi:hypothetical protein
LLFALSAGAGAHASANAMSTLLMRARRYDMKAVLSFISRGACRSLQRLPSVPALRRCEKIGVLGAGRRKRLPHLAHERSAGHVGQALSPANRFFHILTDAWGYDWDWPQNNRRSLRSVTPPTRLMNSSGS